MKPTLVPGSSTLTPDFLPAHPLLPTSPDDAPIRDKTEFRSCGGLPIIATQNVLGNTPRHLAACRRLPVWDWRAALGRKLRILGGTGSLPLMTVSSCENHHISVFWWLFYCEFCQQGQCRELSGPMSGTILGLVRALYRDFLLYEVPKRLDTSR